MPPSTSSPSLCHRLQSCLEPRQALPLLKNLEVHQWVRQPSTTPHDPEGRSAPSHGKETGGGDGWSSLYSLSQPTQSPLAAIDDASFATRNTPPPPPTTYPKKSHQLGKKNWELCTEMLGCETGAFNTPCDFPIEASSTLFAESKDPEREEGLMARKVRKSSHMLDFPPPLTTLSGGGRFRLTSMREHGRLRLLPVKPTDVLEAERKDGRLRLRFLPNGASDPRSKLGEAMGSDARLKAGDKTDEEAEAEREEDEGNDEKNGEEGDYLGVVGKEMNGYGGDEVGMGKYTRAGRCKEEEAGGSQMTRSQHILRCDAFWVASS